MPTNYQFQPLPLANEEEFDNFIVELFNELNQNSKSEFQTYGRRGERQDGIDVICYEDNVVIQCKKKELAHATNVKTLKTKIKKEFRKDLESAITCQDFDFNKFIFATTYPTDTELMNLARDLSQEFDKDVRYMGWGVITQKLHDCPNTLRKFYDYLILESNRLSDSEFKARVKKLHIIDQCYESLIRFDGLKFIEPRIIANLFPFKVNDRRTYPMYNRFCLSTNNDELNKLFEIISVRRKDNHFYVKRGKVGEVRKKCKDADKKLIYIQRVLDNCLIHCIQTTDRVHHKIPGVKKRNCECSGCLSEELRFSDLISSLESAPDSLDKVYGYYRLHNFEDARKSLDNYLKQELNPINLAIGRYNEYWLSILASNERVSKYEFYSKIRSVEFDNEPIQEAIIDLEQDRVLSKAHQKIDSLVDEIKKVYTGYASGKFTTSGPDYVSQLTVETMIVYSHFRHNTLIKDVYPEYHKLFQKALTGWLLSIKTSPKYVGRLESLQLFHIAVSIYYNSGKELLAILRNTETKELILSEGASNYLKEIATNFFRQFDIGNSVYNDYLKNSFEFRGTHRNMFQSLLINLAYSDIVDGPIALGKSLLNFIENENFLYTYDFKFIGLLFEKKGNWFTTSDHITLLKSHLRTDDSDSSEMVYKVLYSFNKYHSESKLMDQELVDLVIKSMGTDLSSYPSISYLRQIVTESILTEIDKILYEKLENDFDSYLYRVILVGQECQMLNDDKLFESYVRHIDENKGVTVGTDKNGFEEIRQYEFINFVSGILYSEKRALNDPIIKSGLNDLSPYQSWLLDPELFDYDRFKIDWIKLSDDKVLLEHLGKSSKLKSVIIKELQSNPNKRLSENLAKMLL